MLERYLENLLIANIFATMSLFLIFYSNISFKIIVLFQFRFKREYIDNQTPSDWVITKLLHVKEKDLFYYQRNLLLKSR